MTTPLNLNLTPNNQSNETMSTKSPYYLPLTGAISIFSLVAGLVLAYQPAGAGFRYFSYHPLCMTIGFIGLFGNAIAAKKYVGGYSYTKLHGNLSGLGLAFILYGWYVIYQNKELMGKPHITSNHAKAGLVTILSSLGLLLFGSIVLHPDWGVGKLNKTYRKLHKLGGKAVVALSWFVCFSGLRQLTNDYVLLASFGLPLLLFFTPMLLL